MAFSQYKSSSKGFTLIEVVLALGIFLISILALIGLLAPMLQSVDEVEKIDEITSVVNTVNAFLQNSPEIAYVDGNTSDNITKFDAIYSAISSIGGNEATIFVYRYYDDRAGSEGQIGLEIGFSPAETGYVGQNSIVNEPGTNPADFKNAAGPIYRVVLTASSVTPLTPQALRTDPRNANGIYTLTRDDPANYPEGYLAMEARIYAEDGPGPDGVFNTTTNLSDLNLTEPDFSFNVAIVR